jgi:hypothetical protein
MAVKRTRQQKFRSLRAANGPRLKSNPSFFRTLVNGERKTFRKAARSNHPLFDFVELQSEEERPQKNDQLGSKVRVRATLEPNHGADVGQVKRPRGANWVTFFTTSLT